MAVFGQNISENKIDSSYITQFDADKHDRSTEN